MAIPISHLWDIYTFVDTSHAAITRQIVLKEINFLSDPQKKKKKKIDHNKLQKFMDFRVI